MKSNYTPDSEIEAEIERLLNDPDVLLAKAEMRIRNRRRNYLYCLRSMAKRGAELRKQGVTHESLGAIEDAIVSEMGEED